MGKNEFAWGGPEICIVCEKRPGRFRGNKLCFVCATSIEAQENNQEEIDDTPANKEEEIYGDLSEEFLDEADLDYGKRQSSRYLRED